MGKGINAQLQDVDIADACCGSKSVLSRASAESAVGAGGEGSGEGSEAKSGGRGEGLEARHLEVEKRALMSKMALCRFLRYQSIRV